MKHFHTCLCALASLCLYSTAALSQQNIAIGDSALQQTPVSSPSNIGIGQAVMFRNMSGHDNIAIGDHAQYESATGHNNLSFGSSTLRNNLTGYENIAIGQGALIINRSGSHNLALGSFALNNNRTGNSNIAIGTRALYSSVEQTSSLAIGDSALFSQRGYGAQNMAIGHGALFTTNVGYNNTAIGFNAMYLNDQGYSNTALGFVALYSNFRGFNNVAVGEKAMFSNTLGNNNSAFGMNALYGNLEGSFNTAMGEGAMGGSTNGNNNTAAGYLALASVQGGYANTAIGSEALRRNTKFFNTAIGTGTLSQSTTGTSNTATGLNAIMSNTTGNYNTATGSAAMSNSTTGGNNTAVGAASFYYNTTGSFNTSIGAYSLLGESGSNFSYGVAVGFYAGFANTGGNNTMIGANSDVATGFTNTSAFGFGSKGTASNQVVLGNTSVLHVVSTGDYMTTSDGRFKKDIKEDVPGLEFIKLLKPVTYHYNIHGLNSKIGAGAKRLPADKDGNSARAEIMMTEDKAIKEKEKILYTGFVAQDVEKAAKQAKYEFSGIHVPTSDSDTYALSYAQFVVPLVKGMQELIKLNEAKDAKIDSLEARLERIESLMKSPDASGVSLSDARLDQNKPNPFTGSTVIDYTLPQMYGRAKILITDMSGRVMQSINVSGKGKGVLTVDAKSLSSGSYPYALYVDDKMVESKQMLLVR